jgi:uncharacterized SAM-binding protein YcdF (DUF218 family)
VCVTIQSIQMREIFTYSFIIPPTILIAISLAGAMIALIRPRFGIILCLSSSVFLYLFATPAVSMLLMQQLVPVVRTNVDFTDAQAIVVPSVDVKWGNDADIPNAVGELTLERLASAARLYRRLRLPIVVNGAGVPDHPNVSAAKLMREELEQNFHVPVQFIEEQSHNTFEHGFYTSQMVKGIGIYNVIIVAQARDIPRLLWSFSKVGLHPMPFPLREPLYESLEIQDFLPSAKAFLESYYEMHELIGLAYYKTFY